MVHAFSRSTHQLFCRVSCFMAAKKRDKPNICKCHPTCKLLNFTPTGNFVTQVATFNNPNCECSGADNCRYIAAFNDKTS